MDQNIMDIHNIDSPRLTARAPRADDFPSVVSLYQNSRVMAKLGGVLTDAEISQRIAFELERWQQDGFGQWYWFEKSTEEFIGRGGLRKLEIENREVVELGYSLLPEYWRKGLATEMAEASLAIGFTRLNLDEIVSFTEINNIASRRVMEKVGFIFDHNFIHGGLPQVMYRLQKK
jgi:ribosomal-protein-alanine N-acetyltransferase